MSSTLLKTKLYIPPLRPELVSRPRLVERLYKGLHRKLSFHLHLLGAYQKRPVLQSPHSI
jgi:hypothetical protein